MEMQVIRTNINNKRCPLHTVCTFVHIYTDIVHHVRFQKANLDGETRCSAYTVSNARIIGFWGARTRHFKLEAMLMQK